MGRRRGCRLCDRRDLPILRGGAARGQRGYSGRPSVCGDARDLPGAGDVRRRTGGGSLQAARRRRAAVVGLNCMRGPQTMLPLLGPIIAATDVPVAALPVPYRTTDATPAFVSLCDAGYLSPPGGRAFPTALDPLLCNRYEIADFTLSAAALGVRYFGLCCGAGPHHIRSMAEALGRTPPASRYSPDMASHALFGNAERATHARARHEQRL